MHQYTYAFYREIKESDVFFKFPKFPEVISAVPKDKFKVMSVRDIQIYVSDAIITALQVRISLKSDVPQGDNSSLVKADGFVMLSVQQAMKLELFKIYKENCRSISEFARQLDKKETSVRRMLDLRHPSVATEIENALEIFGKRLVHSWDIEPASSSSYSTRPTRLPKPEKVYGHGIL